MPLTSAGGQPLQTRAEFGRMMNASWGDEALNRVAVHNGLPADERGRAQVIEFYYRWYLREAGRADLADAREPDRERGLRILREELLAAAHRVGPPPAPPRRRSLLERLRDALDRARVRVALRRNR